MDSNDLLTGNVRWKKLNDSFRDNFKRSNKVGKEGRSNGSTGKNEKERTW